MVSGKLADMGYFSNLLSVVMMGRSNGPKKLKLGIKVRTLKQS